MEVSDCEDTQLISSKCIVNSRSEYDTAITLDKHTFKVPAVPANMQTIIDETTAELLTESGYFYVMHRFDEVARVPPIKKMKKRGLITSIGVGVKKGEYSFIERLAEESLNPDYITTDITHGHANSATDMIQHIKKYSPETFVIADNVGTPEAVRELENAGVNTTKVRINPGKVCIVKIKTGFGTGGWQLAAPRQCAKATCKLIVANGGIRTHGDIAKSVCFRTTVAMVDSLPAGHEESPSETKVENGTVYKKYFGSTSEFQKDEKRNVEGKKIWIQYKGSLKDILVEIQQGFQLPTSYVGGRDPESVRKVGYITAKNSIFNGDTI